MKLKCISCGKAYKRISEESPCCGRCEKTAPMAMVAPGLFTQGPAAMLARSAEKQIQIQKGTAK